MADEERQPDLAAVADVLEAWAEEIRKATPAEEDADRVERNARMAELLVTAAAALRSRAPGDALFDAIRRASGIDADGVPRGFHLVQVYTDGREVVVCGRPAEQGHDCARMGCGPSAHVIFRLRAAEAGNEKG